MEGVLKLDMENRAIKLQENWVKWKPTKNIPEGNYIITKQIQDTNGLKFMLEDGINSLEICFDGITPIFRSSVEGIRMRTWGEVQKRYNDKFFFRNWFIYIVERSKFSIWAEEESCGFYSSEQLTHYCIVTSEEIVDILSPFKPTIKVLSFE